MKLISLVGIFTCMLILHAEAQYFSTGQDPAKIHWRQINTAHFQLIYPEGYEAKAQQLASVFEKVYDYGSKSLNHSPKKISIVLHTHTVKSNGLVAWAPKRIELFTTPHQKIYPQDWLEQLAIHEFRHVVQMDKIQSELPALLPVILGEQAAAIAVAAYLPFWFLEGDAVMTETTLSNTGRGRLPSFLMENKALAIQKGVFKYDKAAFGSYRDFMPSRYHYGYWFAGAIREKYGTEIWSDVLKEIGHNPFSITPFDNVLKRYSGKNKVKLHTEIFQKYQQQWQSELDPLSLTNQKRITGRHQFFTSYLYGAFLNDSGLVALKENRNDVDRIVRLMNNQEETIFTPGNIFQESFSATGELLIWSEKRPDLRWSHADVSVVVVFDINKKSKRSFKFKNKLFSPVISPDFKTFAAVEVDQQNNYSLSVFDLQTGRKINSFSTPDNQYLFTPCWDEKGEKLFLVNLSEKGKYLASVNLESGIFDRLTEPGFNNISNPYYASGKLYFTSSLTGVDNIFCCDTKSLKTFQLSSVQFGAEYPYVGKNQLIFSNYDSEGYHLSLMNLEDGLWKNIDELELKTFHLAENLSNQEDTVLSFLEGSENNFQSKPYSKLGHLFNFHSWAPAFLNVNDYDVKPGFSLFSQNKLGTAETNLGYEYNLTEKAGKYRLGFQYSGFFPVFDSEISYGKRKSDYLLIQNTLGNFGNIIQSDTITQNYSWNEFDVDMGLHVPLYFSQGKYTQIIQPKLEYSFRKVTHDQTTPVDFYEGHYHSLSYQLYIQNLLKQSELDVFPNWGQVAEVFYRHNPLGGMQIGHLKAAQSYLFFPGLMANHGIRIYNAYQEKNTEGSVSYADVVKYPRGTTRIHNSQLYSFKSDYAFPFAYPDLNIGPFAYIKRLRASLFYDYAHFKGNVYNTEGSIIGHFSKNLNTLGVELIGDGHLLRLVAPVSTGIRAIYLPNTRDYVFEFLFSVSFNSI